MPTITLKNIPDELYLNLKQSAAANHRSMNREAIARLEHSLDTRERDPEAILERVRRLREKFRGPPITDAEMTKAKREGRP
jgi:antitoxin FitA